MSEIQTFDFRWINGKREWGVCVNGGFLAVPDHLAAIAEKDKEIAYYKDRACCDPDNKWGHTPDCGAQWEDRYSGLEHRADDLRREIAELKAELKKNFKESVAVIHDLGAEKILLEERLKLFNPCGHTGAESSACGVCGYPDSRKLIAELKHKIVILQNEDEMKVRSWMASSKICVDDHNKLSEKVALGAKLLAAQHDRNMEMETALTRIRNAIGDEPCNGCTWARGVAEAAKEQAIKVAE